jgi:hypothetical protein
MMVPPRWRLVAVGVLGLGLTVFVLQSAISSFTAESRARAAASRIGRAERFHQDADQAHDAMHADVLDVLRLVRAGDPRRAEAALSVLERDTQVYRRNMDRVDAMGLRGSVGSALATLRPAQLEYAASGLRLGRLAVRDAAAADTQLAAFDSAFLRLVRAQGSVTAELADEVEHRVGRLVDVVEDEQRRPPVERVLERPHEPEQRGVPRQVVRRLGHVEPRVGERAQQRRVRNRLRRVRPRRAGGERVVAAGAELGGEARLADARLADERHELRRPRPRPSEHAEQELQLALATGERHGYAGARRAVIRPVLKPSQCMRPR